MTIRIIIIMTMIVINNNNNIIIIIILILIIIRRRIIITIIIVLGYGPKFRPRRIRHDVAAVGPCRLAEKLGGEDPRLKA